MSDAVPIFLVDEAALKSQHSAHEAWLSVCRFKAKAGASCLIPGSNGGLEKVLVGKPDPLDTWTLGKAAQSLPPYRYYLADALSDESATKLCLGWQLGQYQFSMYKQKERPPLAELTFPDNADRDYVDAATSATFLVRDLINTPANDMGPSQLEGCARKLAETHQADLQVILGKDLAAQQYPLIYAVGKASEQSPRLLDLKWGDETAPKVTLVGKGVCFDSGGLDVKSASGMKMMKKDMGGAAQVLGLAQMIMRLNLPIRLRVLTPAVENSISGDAMRPLDVLTSRKGITVEVGNTDAEGRLVLADALWEACCETPDLLIDCATLTGAARVALGTEMPAFFCSQTATATTLQQAAQQTDDPLWQLPLNQAYRSMLDSKVADISNISSAIHGGAITAALFLQEFVKSDIPWVHVDLMGWNLRSLPGRPEGGEAMGMRALFELVRRVLA